MRIEDAVRDALRAALPGEIILEEPPSPEMGDLAVPCFSYAKALRKSPAAIASEIASAVSGKGPIVNAVAAGPYCNLFLDRSFVAQNVLSMELGVGKKNQKLLFEYPSPNTNKPLHLGHLRNMLLGSSAAAIAEAAGYSVVRTNLYNDRGVHICKSMLAYQRWGEGKTPADLGMKPDHFVGHWYVEFAKHAKEDESLENEAQEMLRKWEDGDKVVRSLWKKMNDWAYEGFTQSFDRLGITFDKHYYESQLYDKGKAVVEHGLKVGVFSHDENGNTRASLGTLGEPVVLRADGTAVYMTQDLYLAQVRQDEWKPDAQVYVVGSEQDHRFKQLFAILEALGMEHADRLFHLSYGLIALPEGRMKSREGTVVDCDDLLNSMEALAAEAVQERHPELSAKEVQKRAKTIGHGALRFFICKYEPKTGFVYDPKESLSFEGETGPYVQYAAARISSILAETKPGKADASLLSEDEAFALLMALRKTPAIVEEAASQYKPHLVARHAMSVAQAFTGFYHTYKVLVDDAKVRDSRLALLKATRAHLAYLLGLLGIEAPEAM